MSILVIPKYHMKKHLDEDRASLEFLDKRHEAGNELVVHGFYHYVKDPRAGNFFWNRLYTNRESEFLDLSDGEVRHRIQLGLDLWESRGWKASGFIAPAWLMPKKQDAILRNMGLKYTNRLRSISLLQKKKEIQTTSLCYSARAGWRRQVSLSWNQALFNRLRKEPVIRLSLHPADLTYDPIRQQIREILEMALAEDYRPVTYARYATL
jgi:predicted deacetylase